MSLKHRLAVSAIAWPHSAELEALELLNSLGIRFLETVPTRASVDPAQYVSILRKFQISPVAFQALLFGTDGLHLFQSEVQRGALQNHLIKAIKLASQIGVYALVFGSPKNRFIPGFMKAHEAHDIALRFFREVGMIASQNNVVVCIEPNPVSYGCNFLNTTTEAASFVREVSSTGIKLNFDLGTCSTNNEDVGSIFASSKDVVGHLHISEPALSQVLPKGSFSSFHRQLASSLLESKYNGTVSIEMSTPSGGDWKERVRDSVQQVKELYATT